MGKLNSLPCEQSFAKSHRRESNGSQFAFVIFIFFVETIIYSKANCSSRPGLEFVKATGENRTLDLLITNQLLYRLSYCGVLFVKCFSNRCEILSIAKIYHGTKIIPRMLFLYISNLIFHFEKN